MTAAAGVIGIVVRDSAIVDRARAASSGIRPVRAAFSVTLRPASRRLRPTLLNSAVSLVPQTGSLSEGGASMGGDVHPWHRAGCCPVQDVPPEARISTC